MVYAGGRGEACGGEKKWDVPRDTTPPLGPAAHGWQGPNVGMRGHRGKHVCAIPLGHAVARRFLHTYITTTDMLVLCTHHKAYR